MTLGALSGDAETGVRKLPGNLSECTEEEVDALFAIEAAEEEERRRGRGVAPEITGGRPDREEERTGGYAVSGKFIRYPLAAGEDGLAGADGAADEPVAELIAKPVREAGATLMQTVTAGGEGAPGIVRE